MLPSNQHVEIGEVAQGEVAVHGLGEHWPFQRDRWNRVRFEAVEHAKQFGRELQVLPRVVLIVIAKLSPTSREARIPCRASA